ncbi:hypothetical protein [Dyella sp. 2HG41-7]|uniref:hypothetical protein n=1 Tax=Dyella sp. 2HG41-7 TaxID=2883239 RepID=UPI001F29F2DD|nr:hypothetical protein [Dyella sp. 2HG41-7]
MRKHSLLLCLGLASGACGAAPSEPPQVIVHGTVTTASGEHPAWLTLMCTQGSGGALSLMLALTSDNAPEFPFDAFEGPGAPASHQPSAQFRIGQQSFAPVAVSGWYSAEGHGVFVFGASTTSKRRNSVVRAAALLSKPGVTFTWIQNSNNIQTPPLVAHFQPDSTQSRALMRMAAPCLPNAKQPQR